MGFRLAGTLEYHILWETSGINTLEMMVNFALMGKMSDIDIKKYANPYFKKWSCNVTFLAKPGKIGKIVGIEEIALLPEVIAIIKAYNEGDIIPSSALGTLAQVVVRVFAITCTKQQLCEVMNKVQNTINVYSEDGKDMLLPTFDTKELFD
jgi:hypothetical protein